MDTMTNEEFLTLNDCAKLGKTIGEILSSKVENPLKGSIIFFAAMSLAAKLENEYMAMFIENTGKTGLVDLIEREFPDNPYAKELANAVRKYKG